MDSPGEAFLICPVCGGDYFLEDRRVTVVKRRYVRFTREAPEHGGRVVRSSIEADDVVSEEHGTRLMCSNCQCKIEDRAGS